MKLFFGINITADKNNERMDGEDFITERITDSQEKALEDSGDVLDGLQSKAKLPPLLRALYYLCGVISIMLGVGIARALTEIPLAQAYQNAPVLFWILPIALIVWGVLALLQRNRQKQVNESPEAQAAVHKSEALIHQSYDMLSVPKTAADMDVLCVQYRVKNEQIAMQKLASYSFINTELKVFVQDGALCFADVNQKFSVPLEMLQSIRAVSKRICLPTWNKPKHYNEPPYQDYKITANRYGFYSKPYYALCILRDGVPYELYFPCYELPLIQSLTGLAVTEQNENT